MAGPSVAEESLADDAAPLPGSKRQAKEVMEPADSDDELFLKQRPRGRRARAVPRAATDEARPDVPDSGAKGGTARRRWAAEEGGAPGEGGAGAKAGKGRGRQTPVESSGKKKGKRSAEVLDPPKEDSAEGSGEESDGYVPGKGERSAGGESPTKAAAAANGEAAEGPKTPPSTIEGGTQGEEPSSPAPASADQATASKPGTRGVAPEEPCLGCFNLCIWFERDRTRVLGMPKRHAVLRSVTVSEALDRQQQLSAKQRPQEPGTKKAPPLGFPLQTVLTSKQPGDKILAVEFGASSSATSKLIPLADIYTLRRWAGDCQGKEGKLLALASHCFKVQGQPGLVAFLGPGHVSKSPAFKEKRGEGDEAEDEDEEEDADSPADAFFSSAGGKYKAENADSEVLRFVQFITDIKGGCGPGLQKRCPGCQAKAEKQQEAEEGRKRKLEEARVKEMKRQKTTEAQKEKEKAERQELARQLKAAKEVAAALRKEAERAAKLAEKRAAELTKARRDKEEACARMENALEEAKAAAEGREEWARNCEDARAKANEQVKAAAREFEEKLKTERAGREAEVQRRLGVERRKMQAEMDAKLEKMAKEKGLGGVGKREKEEWEAERTRLLKMVQEAAQEAASKEKAARLEKEEMLEHRRFLEERLRSAQRLAEELKGNKDNGKGSGADCKNCPMCRLKAQAQPPPMGCSLEELRSRAAEAARLEQQLRDEVARAAAEAKKRSDEVKRRQQEEDKRRRSEEARKRKAEAKAEEAREKAETERLFQERLRREAEERRRQEQRRAEEQRKKEEEAQRMREAQQRSQRASQDVETQTKLLEAQLEEQFMAMVRGTDRLWNYDKYESMINQLRNSTSSSLKLSFFDIPWPPPKNPLFFLEEDSPAVRKRKANKALLFWHTDKFNAICRSRLLPEHQLPIDAKVRRIAQEVIEAKAALSAEPPMYQT